MEIAAHCPHCHRFTHTDSLGSSCRHCQKALFGWVTDDLADGLSLNQCPVCGAGDLYRQKDFNRKLGIGILVIGIALAYFTYGISLVVVTLLDWWLFRRVKELGVCYQCGSQFRGGDLIQKLEPFNLVLHDHYRNRNKDTKGGAQ